MLQIQKRHLLFWEFKEPKVVLLQAIIPFESFIEEEWTY
jgi:hypothetical protein